MSASSPYLVPAKGRFNPEKAPTSPPRGAPGRKALKEQLAEHIDAMRPLQRKLYADNRFALLLIFQALDAAGKDGTIRAVTRGLNPAGFQVHSFKAPSPEELDHDFLWRACCRLPERGRIGVFNRSYYEETLVVRVHPDFIQAQRLPGVEAGSKLWKQRFESIRAFERHLSRNGTLILKFWLNISRDEQRRRFLDRIEEPRSNWKFSSRDVEERRHWKAYMRAYADAVSATSRPWAPWYAIPADDKPFMRATVAGLIRRRLEALRLDWPELDPEEREKMRGMKARLEAE